MKTVHDVDFFRKRVLVRCDFNVPLDAGKIADDARLRAHVPTINLLLAARPAQVVLCSHLGRPGGKPDPQLRLTAIAARLAELLGRPVAKVDGCVDVVLPNDPLVLLENLRFEPGEEANDLNFAKRLLGNCTVFVNDAFAVSHRAAASVVAVATLVPSCAGLLLEKEIKMLTLQDAKPPVVAVLGGVKLETKLPIIEHLLPRVEKLVIGGAMMFTFYKARGLYVSDSIVQDSFMEAARRLLGSDKLVLPTDVVVAPRIEELAPTTTVSVESMPEGVMGLDIGAESLESFKHHVAAAKTVIWNGPLGVFEMEPFAAGTIGLARHLAALRGVTTIVGGGDTVAAVEKLGLQAKFTHVSTGGGAALSLLAGEKLPAVEALEESEKIFFRKK